MANYPHLQYSVNAVRKAGELLKRPIVIDDAFGLEERDAVIEAFSVANSFRDSHVYPMRSIRLSVLQRMRRMGVTGLTAARPKRMSSIRRKLASGSMKLDQMQDLGGVRIITDDNAGVQAVIGMIRDGYLHRIRKEYPYIHEPKADGYRSHHVVFEYVGEGRSEPFDGRRIELQIRTRLQHTWATAVEAIGLFRGEDLKHGNGSEDWLRLFALASAEFSYSEGCPIHPSMPDRNDRIRELKDLNARLQATQTLENIKNLTHYAENFIFNRARFYLIRYETDHRVRVEPYHSPVAGAVSLARLEEQIEAGENDSKVVLVEVDKIDRLVETYPNYFGDVSLFVRNLKSICEGRSAVEYSMIPQERVPTRRVERGDSSNLRRSYSRWTDAWTGNGRR